MSAAELKEKGRARSVSRSAGDAEGRTQRQPLFSGVSERSLNLMGDFCTATVTDKSDTDASARGFWDARGVSRKLAPQNGMLGRDAQELICSQMLCPLFSKHPVLH